MVSAKMQFFMRGGMLGGGCNCGPRSCDHKFEMRPGVTSFKKQAKAKKNQEKKSRYRGVAAAPVPSPAP